MSITIIHLILQHHNTCSKETLNPGDLDALFLYYGCQPSELGLLRERVNTVLDAVSRNEIAQWMFAQVQDLHVEYPISAKVNGQILSGIIDRTFIDGEGNRWIIDYKVPHAEPENLVTFLDLQQEQYTMQLERYAKIMAQKESRPIKLGLFFPLIPAWRAWDYESRE